MSDSSQMWVLAILVLFMVGGLLWLLLARMRQIAPKTTASMWPMPAMDEAGMVRLAGRAPVLSAVDVTLSRGPYGLVPLDGDVAASTRAGIDAALAAGGSSLDGLVDDAGSATVGSELSDTTWTTRPA